jgi:ferrous iron transport protein B
VTSCHPDAAAPSADAPPGVLTALLVGRPNSGKSSLYNALTGGDARVANYPGITVDVLEAAVTLPGGARARIVDLPGTYSLEAPVDPEADEGVARRSLEQARAEGGPLVVAQVVDSTNLELGLRLTQELTRLGLPLVLLVTQSDVLEAEGRVVDVAAIERAVGVPALWVSARRPDTRGRVLDAIEALARRPASRPRAFDAAQVASDALADARLALHRRTERLDRWLMHPIVGPAVFLASMAALFTAVFWIADPASALVGGAVQLASAGVRRVLGDGRLASFVCDGVIDGAGTVLQFLPQIVLLTVALELIEASGYLARGAYLVDRLLRAVGLGGRSFVPLLMGHACAVPAITATRMIRDPRQRLKTMLVLPLMTCSARIPAYALLIVTFLSRFGPLGRALTFLTLYASALVLASLASLVIDVTVMRGRRHLPLVLELPPYRAPQLRVVGRTAWRGATRFLHEVGTMIVAVSAVLWVLLSVPIGHASPSAATAPQPLRTEALSHSAAAVVGRALEPVTRPLGFDWRINVGLIASFGARELMVSTMGVIFGMESAEPDDVGDLPARIRGATTDDGRAAYTTATGLALLVFFMIACQCMSTVSALRRETGGWKWPAFVVGYTYAAAYALALVVHRIAVAAGFG